jgi:predicted phosphodiesterase
MRILPLSDLHREIYPERDLGIDLEVCRPDVVILAGDIDKGTRAVQWAAEAFKGIQVLYVAGNHEFYGAEIDTVPKAIQAACEQTTNVTYLDRESFIIGGVRFLGATLWTDFALFGKPNRPIAKVACGVAMNDYRQIRFAANGYRKINPEDTALVHALTRNYLEQELAKPFDGKTVVVTHMAPSRLSVPEQFAQDIVSSAYASNLDYLTVQADLWIHGHTHTSMNYHLFKCNVVANPCGYQHRGGLNENPNFNPNLIIEI